MKNILLIITSLLVSNFVFSQTNGQDIFDFYFESSKDRFDNATYDWYETDEKAIKRVGYWRGSPCGDVPETARVIGKMHNDTIFINYNFKRVPMCDPAIGIAANAIDLVVNKKKYPNFRNLIIKEVKNEDCKTDSCFINNVNEIINKSFIKKEEVTINSDSRGSYEVYTIYSDYNIPILIERNIKEVIHYDYLDNSTEEKLSYISAKFYIKSWEKNEFIRVGTFKTLLNDGEFQEKAMPIDYDFTYDKDAMRKMRINKRISR